MDKNKKIIIGTIFAITSVLAGLSIYVSYELRNDYSPEESSADTSTPVPTVVEPTKDLDKKKVIPTKVPPTKVPPTKVVVAPTRGGVIATPIPSRPLPSTALVNDRVDAAILGTLMMITGVYLYKKYFSFGGKNNA